MDAHQKLLSLQQQKRRLKQRIGEIGSLESESQALDPELQRLLQKKKALQGQQRKKAEYHKLEQQYNQRKRQMQREKELQRVQNEKRVLQLQAAMKRVVFEGIKQKVKGMNSEQLMKRGFLHNQDDPQVVGVPSQDGNFKQIFEGYLLDQGPAKLQPKYDVKQLNQKRMAIFERKEQIVMRQILLKELAAADDPAELDVMGLTREQLERELQKREISFEDYMHPIRKEEVIDHLPILQQTAEARIGDKKREIQQGKEQILSYQRYKKGLREEVKSMPYKDVEVVKRLLYDLFDQLCDDYEKRHVPLTAQDQTLRVRNLEQQYTDLSNQRLVEQLSQELVKQMLEDMRDEMRKEAAEEVYKLHDYAHQKTEECFKSIFNEGEVLERIRELDSYKFALVFAGEEENQLGRAKEDKYMKKLQNDCGIYETEENTTNLVNDITLLDTEEKFIEKVNTRVNNKIQYKTEDTTFCYDRELIAVSRQAIKSVSTGKVYYALGSKLQQIAKVVKAGRSWLLQTQHQILLLTPWGRQELGNQLGARISNPCGLLTCSELYPVSTILGNPCSCMLGFEKGQVLKFNFNRNRVTGRQLNLTHYMPVIDHAKSGDDPAFPLDTRNYLPVQIEKPKANDELHQYRQFFEHHSQPVVFIGFYRIDKFVTVDRSLKCALWQYSKSRGTGSYEPVFKFEIRSSYQVFTQDENPRYKDIYPTSSFTETPEEMYQRYMLTENFLRLQLYNNPKKEIAYFRAPQWDSSSDEKPIWKITYKQNKGQVSKILESFYNVSDGKITAQQALICNATLYVLCEREHIIRSDLKTIKIYSWSINEKRLGRVGLEIDMFKDQKVSNFMILNNHFQGLQTELALIVNSGRLLMFSLVSGQLLKNINEEVRSEGKEAEIYFKAIVRAADRGIVYGISNGGVMELSWDDSNSINERNRLNKAIDGAKRKFFR